MPDKKAERPEGQMRRRPMRRRKNCLLYTSARSKDVADGQQVEIPVLRYDRTVGTRVESTSREWNPGASEVGVW